VNLRVAVWTWVALLCVALPHAARADAPVDRQAHADRPIYRQAFALAGKADYRAARVTALQGRQALLNKFFIWLDLVNAEDANPTANPTADPNADPIADEFTVLDAFLRANRGWPRLAAIQRRAEQRLPAGFSHRDVIDWFAQREPLSAAGVLRLAEALRAVGDEAAAGDLARSAWRGLSFTTEQEAVFLARHGAGLQASDEIARLDRLLSRWDFPAAERQAKRLGGGYPRLAKAVERLMRNRPGVDAAIARVPPELQDDPTLLYERARWRLRRGRHDGVVELLDRAADSVRRPERWWPIRHWAAREALDLDDTALAYRLASRHGLKSGIGFAEGEWFAGWLALRFEQAPAQAYQHFVRLYDGVTTPISRSRGAYWAGVAAERLGQSDSARTWYRRAADHATAFYGQQALARLDGTLDLDLTATVAVSEAERGAFDALELVRLVRLLAAFDAQQYVTTFLSHLRQQADTPVAHRLHAELAEAIGRPDQALFTAKQASGRGMAVGAHLFPVPADIAPHLDGDGPPEPALVLALIRQESAFDRRAVSRAGARGLMQLMPATARLVAKKIKLPYRRADLTEDPSYNMTLGRAYLGQLLEEFEGSTALALAAYNAGPHRVARWIAAFGDPRRPEVDPVDWIERIPFSETRNYVQRVLESQVVYRLALDGQKTVLPLDRKGKELGALP
jgi:soluble lytic murein transglycosylase